MENCFDRVPLFQVYFYGLGTQLWKLDVLRHVYGLIVLTPTQDGRTVACCSSAASRMSFQIICVRHSLWLWRKSYSNSVVRWPQPEGWLCATCLESP